MSTMMAVKILPGRWGHSLMTDTRNTAESTLKPSGAVVYIVTRYYSGDRESKMMGVGDSYDAAKAIAERVRLHMGKRGWTRFYEEWPKDASGTFIGGPPGAISITRVSVMTESK
jgi:hypothetical protein